MRCSAVCRFYAFLYILEAREGRCRESVFFFNDTATTEIYTRSLHDALPILRILVDTDREDRQGTLRATIQWSHDQLDRDEARSEEHTSELQSRQYLVCRLLLEKKHKEAGHA